jgi:hypothetical protein
MVPPKSPSKEAGRQVGSTIAPYSALIAAIISALVILFGYVDERNRQREFQISQTRQEIYTRLITNLTKMHVLLGKVKNDPRIPKPTTENLSQWYELIAQNYPDLNKSMDEAVEIMALLSVYGSDEAIEASARYYEKSIASLQPGSSEAPDAGQLVLELRRSLFPDTQVSAKDIDLITSK